MVLSQTCMLHVWNSIIGVMTSILHRGALYHMGSVLAWEDWYTIVTKHNGGNVTMGSICFPPKTTSANSFDREGCSRECVNIFTRIGFHNTTTALHALTMGWLQQLEPTSTDPALFKNNFSIQCTGCSWLILCTCMYNACLLSNLPPMNFMMD